MFSKQEAVILACHLCQRQNLVEILDLGSLPIAHRYRPIDQLNNREETFPFVLESCTDCGLIQIKQQLCNAIKLIKQRVAFFILYESRAQLL